MSPSSEPELPPLQTAQLDSATLVQLFDEIETLDTPPEVLVKWADHEQTPDHRVSLAEARRALLDGRAFGVQLRYRLDGSLWFDSLMRHGDGVRLVRIAHPLSG